MRICQRARSASQPVPLCHALVCAQGGLGHAGGHPGPGHRPPVLWLRRHRQEEPQPLVRQLRRGATFLGATGSVCRDVLLASRCAAALHCVGDARQCCAPSFSTPLEQAYGLNDAIGCLLDCEGATLAFTKNGQALGPAFQLPQVRGACAWRLAHRLAHRWAGPPAAALEGPAAPHCRRPAAAAARRNERRPASCTRLACPLTAAPARPGAVPGHLFEER